jgi:hypothetical protein
MLGRYLLMFHGNLGGCGSSYNEKRKSLINVKNKVAVFTYLFKTV